MSLNKASNSQIDVEWGSFSESASWVLDFDEVQTFQQETLPRREKSRIEAKDLLRKRKIPPIVRSFMVLTKILNAVLLWYLLDRKRGREKSRQGIARKLRKRFEKLGSTYVKLGQIISSGEGLFPEQLVAEFKLLRDKVPAESFSDVKDVIEQEYSMPIESVFARFEKTPIASASIAQVHRATLITGENVVVKVQRPKVENLVKKDIKALWWLAPKLVGRIPVSSLANPPALVELFAETIIEELDFRLEADNMLEISKVLAETDQRAIIVPRPKLDLVTKRVLVMEEMQGFSFDDVQGMQDAGIDTYDLLRAGLIAFTEGALLHGVFHGDLHGGNLLVRPDGKTTLLDFGITGRFNDHQRKAFLRLLVAGTSGNVHQQVVALIELGAFPSDTDVDVVVSDLDLDGPVKDPTKMSGEQLTSEMGVLTKKLLGYGAKAPKELTLFVKNLMFLDGATATLAPELDILGEIQHVQQYFVQTYGAQIIADLGITSDNLDLNVDAIKNSIGVADDVESLTYKDLLRRRDTIKKRMTQKDVD